VATDREANKPSVVGGQRQDSRENFTKSTPTGEQSIELATVRSHIPNYPVSERKT
jgi:hypothetical protein